MEGSTEKEHSWDKVNVICGRSCPVPIARGVVCDSPTVRLRHKQGQMLSTRLLLYVDQKRSGS